MAPRFCTALRASVTLATLSLLASCSSPLPTDIPDSDGDLLSARRPTASGWKQLSTGTGPTAIKSVAHAPAQRAIFVSSVQGDYQPGTLWRFDLKKDRWTQLTAGSWPIGKYRKLVHDPVRRRLLTYWDGIGQVYSIPDTGGTWVAEGTAGNSDEFYEAYAWFDPVTSELTVFGGYGWFAWRNTLWGWDPVSQWQQLPQGDVVPAPRFGPYYAVTVDRQRLRTYITGRIADTNWDDLWSFDLVTRQWNQLIAPITGDALIQGAGLTVAENSGRLYRFGGMQLSTQTYTRALQFTDPDAVPVEWKTIPVSGTAPSPRGASHLVYDQPRQRLIVVSGADGGGWIDDVWAFQLP